MLKTYHQKHCSWKIRNIILNKESPFGTVGLGRILAIVLQVDQLKFPWDCNSTICAMYRGLL